MHEAVEVVEMARQTSGLGLHLGSQPAIWSDGTERYFLVHERNNCSIDQHAQYMRWTASWSTYVALASWLLRLHWPPWLQRRPARSL